jgi:hypothetical protein
MYYVGGGYPSALVQSTYYCPYCFSRFEALALADTPDLYRDEVNEDAAAVQLDALLHLTKHQRRYKTHATGRSPSMVMMFPVTLIIGRLPFKRHYLTGDALARHAAEVQKKMCLDGD